MKPAAERGLTDRGKARHAGARLPAGERRSMLIDAALVVFSTGSYSGATTAQIAREAGVSEPILYRHFASKKELYFACLDEAWRRLESSFDATIAELGPAEAWRALGPSAMRELKELMPILWMQAVTEAGEDEEIRRYVRRHMRQVHDYFAVALGRVQDAGEIPADRDMNAEAWIFIAGSLLAATAQRLGGPLSADEFAAIKTQRRRWLFGSG
jgi:AcrR family transcriptional regulator